ncbi:MAG: nitroreductase family protein [Clostridia bacterium]|nr:nitroreductase family protein [Clostridia bacterium]
MELLELAKARYSVRKFAEKPVEEEKLQKVLAAGACAPTAKNQQPQKIYVLESEDAIEKIRGITRCAFNAPVVLMVCGCKDQAWVNPFNDRSSAEMDCSIVTTQMMLQAQELGLGTCWVCWFDTKQTKEAFNIPENEEVFALLPLGYPAESSHPSSMHDSRKALEETVVRL